MIESDTSLTIKENPTLDFALDMFLSMDLDTNSNVYSLAKGVTVDPTYALGTRVLALQVVAKFGTKADFPFLYDFLSSSDETLQEAGIKAIQGLHKKLTGDLENFPGRTAYRQRKIYATHLRYTKGWFHTSLRAETIPSLVANQKLARKRNHMEVPHHWRLKAQRYRLVGSICPICGQVSSPPHQVCAHYSVQSERIANGELSVFQIPISITGIDSRTRYQFADRMIW